MHSLITRLWQETGMTVFMVTHDMREAFKLGTRVLTFDKLRHDPDDPKAYGATITYDLPVQRRAAASDILTEASEHDGVTDEHQPDPAKIPAQ